MEDGDGDGGGWGEWRRGRVEDGVREVGRKNKYRRWEHPRLTMMGRGLGEEDVEEDGRMFGRVGWGICVWKSRMGKMCLEEDSIWNGSGGENKYWRLLLYC